MNERGKTGLPLLLLGCAIVLSSIPASTGGFVYDDWHMRGNPAMSGFDDVWGAFWRTSYDYFRQGADDAVTGATYRPLAHVTLIGVQAIFGDAPLVHHAVSLGLHLACVLCVYAACALRAPRMTALALAFVFGLHPLGIEAYGWINGRADLLAGTALAALAVLFAAGTHRRVTQTLAAAALALTAVLAKETALIAVLALAAAESLPKHGSPRSAPPAPKVRAIAGVALGVALALTVRALLVGTAHAGGVALRAQQDLAAKFARLYAEALQSTLVPLPRTMASLAWELSQPLDMKEMALLAIFAAAFAVLVIRGSLRSATLLAGAVVTLAPTVVVGSSFWCGFDRYLYMPGILACLAVAESPLGERLGTLAARWMWPAIAVIALLLGSATFATAQNYHSQSAFMASMIQLKPDDPSGYLFGAGWLNGAGRREEAAKLLEHVPLRGLPRPLASALATRLSRVGRRDAAVVVLNDMIERYPDDPYALYDIVATSIQRNDLGRAFAAAEKLRGRAGFCQGVLAVLAAAQRRPSIDHVRLAAFRQRYACR